MVDLLLVSLGGTAGLRAADASLAGSLRRAGASVEVVRVPPARELRTFAWLDFAAAVNARRSVEADRPRHRRQQRRRRRGVDHRARRVRVNGP